MLTSAMLYFYFIFVDSYVMLLTLPLNYVAVRTSVYLEIQTLHGGLAQLTFRKQNVELFVFDCLIFPFTDLEPDFLFYYGQRMSE